MRIGLIADTHLPSLMRSLDELGPQVAEAMRDVDLILHAGDVTAPIVLDWCAQFADVLVAEGNNDLFHDPRMREQQFLDIEGYRIGMAHELRPESRPIEAILASALGGEKVDILIGGDTHVERIEFRDGVMLINSGSPTLPHHLSTRLGTVGILEVTRGRISAEIIALGPSEGLRNPAHAQHLVLADGRYVQGSVAGVPLSEADFLRLPAERLKHALHLRNTHQAGAAIEAHA
ncbi:MAG: metallophosphoesterase family protein [Dehalococcoidia bacterium]